MADAGDEAEVGDELARIDPVVEGRLGTPLPPSVAPSIVISGPAQRRGSAQLASKVHRESPSDFSRCWQRFASNSQRFLPEIPSDYQRFYQRISWQARKIHLTAQIGLSPQRRSFPFVIKIT